jgi:hypothetical protein
LEYFFDAYFYFQLNQKNIPKTLTLPLALAGSVSKPKLSHSVKFYKTISTKKKPSSEDFFLSIETPSVEKEKYVSLE